MVISVESFSTWGAFCMLSLLRFPVEGWTPSKFQWGSGLDPNFTLASSHTIAATHCYIIFISL